jgi:hypothetical protein
MILALPPDPTRQYADNRFKGSQHHSRACFTRHEAAERLEALGRAAVLTTGSSGEHKHSSI